MTLTIFFSFSVIVPKAFEGRFNLIIYPYRKIVMNNKIKSNGK